MLKEETIVRYYGVWCDGGLGEQIEACNTLEQFVFQVQTEYVIGNDSIASIGIDTDSNQMYSNATMSLNVMLG